MRRLVFGVIGSFFMTGAAAAVAGSDRNQAVEYACPAETGGTISYPQIVAKYADPDSRFVTLEGKDGIRVHYKDDGSGPAVLLIHSSSGDVKDWAPWVEVLRDDYRVVRLDLPAFGLTGMVPSHNYSIERFHTLIDALMDHVGIQRFAIVGLSYVGTVAFRYAATRVDRVTALVLGNSAGIEYGGRGGTEERDRHPNPVFKPSRRDPEFTETFLNAVINDPEKVTPELIERKTDFANVACRDWESFTATRLYERGNPQRVLGHVRAPSLILWGGDNSALSVSTADAFADALKNAENVEKIIYEGAGHLIHIDRPKETVRDVKAFFDQHIR